MEKAYVFILFLLAKHSDTAKILAALPFPSISHQVVFRPLTQELARRGHEVTVITPNPAFQKGQTPPNLTEVDIHDLSYAGWGKAIVGAVQGQKLDVVALSEFLGRAMINIMELQFGSEQIKKLLDEEKEFDLVITEACMTSALIFSHIYKAPVIQISSFGSSLYNSLSMGMPTHPLLYPGVLSKKVYNLTGGEKISELYDFYRITALLSNVEVEDAMLKRVFGPSAPSILELIKNVDMLLLNTHSTWDGNIPLPPGVIRIWGIHKRREEGLPEDLKSYLDSSKHGVIYMSFGTNAFPSMLPAEKIQAFVKVFSELPYDVLWKWDQDELPGRTQNIRIGKWFPQSDLLRHPKIKLFITQGGIQSTEESINAGVPFVGVPMLGDQYSNVQKYVHYQIGTSLDMETLTADEVKKAIRTVLTNDSYRQNIVKLRTIMQDEPESALERAVWWTEYVLRHKGAKHLRAAAANLSWSEYYEITLISTVIINITIASLAVLLVVRYVFNYVKCFTKILISKQKKH